MLNRDNKNTNKCLQGIPPDDLYIDQFVTLIKHPTSIKHQRVLHDCESEDDRPIVVVNHEISQEGVPFRVIGISWPWAIFALLLPGGYEEGPVIRDLRKVTCFRLNDQYVEAIANFKATINPEED